MLIQPQLDSGLGGICAIEPLHSGHGDDIDILIGVTNNSIVEGSLNSTFHPVVQVCDDKVLLFLRKKNLPNRLTIDRVSRKLLVGVSLLSQTVPMH